MIEIMYDLDAKNRKILYQLDINCRQSNASIGKKVGLSKEVVNYRIKKLENDGIKTYTNLNHSIIISKKCSSNILIQKKFLYSSRHIIITEDTSSIKILMI